MTIQYWQSAVIPYEAEHFSIFTLNMKLCSVLFICLVVIRRASGSYERMPPTHGTVESSIDSLFIAGNFRFSANMQTVTRTAYTVSSLTVFTHFTCAGNAVSIDLFASAKKPNFPPMQPSSVE